LSSGQLAKVYGFADLDGSQPDAWRCMVEVQDKGKPADVTGYRWSRAADRSMPGNPEQLVHAGTCLWPAALMVWGPGLAAGRHAHYCAQLAIALEGRLRVRARANGRWRRCTAVVVGRNIVHEIDARDAFVMMAFVGAEISLDAMVATPLQSPIGVVSTEEAARWRRELGDAKTLDATRVKQWVRSTLIRSTPDVDSRVDRVIRMLRQQPLDTRSTSLVRLSRVAGLSPSRFGHVFTESFGVPVRPYLRWLRFLRAARELVSGRSVTHAAHIAGFADAAHLTRTCRRTLGISPRILTQRAS
jgi:AraC-like DNA-binding protein